MTRPSPEQESLITRALTVQPIGEVPETVLAYTRRWFGPRCVRVEVTGRSASEYDDQNTTEYGDIQACGYDEAGTMLSELFPADEDFEGSYFEELASFEADLASGEAQEEDRPEQQEEAEYGTYAHEAQVSDLAGLPENVRCYWGPPERDPYRAERALLARLAAL